MSTEPSAEPSRSRSPARAVKGAASHLAGAWSTIALWTSALSQRHLDVALKTGSHITTRIIEYPGEWMADEELGQLVDDLRSVASKTLPDGQLTYGVFSGDRERLSRAIITILRDRATGKPIAFNALSGIDLKVHGRDMKVIHLGLVMVDPDVRSKGLSWVLYGLTCQVLFARNQFRPLWHSNVTQVPALIGMMSETFSDVYPHPAAPTRRSFEHLLIARRIMESHRHVFGVGPDAGFDEARFVITNAYTGGSDDLRKTFDQAPKHRNDTYNTFCAEQLDYDRGDDVLQLGRMDLAAGRRLLGDVPRRFLPSVLGTLLMVAFQRAALPAVHWFSAERHWGILRPWTR